MASEIPEIFHYFGSQLNAFMSVGILLKYLRFKLLQLGWSMGVTNLGISRLHVIISLPDNVVFRCFFYRYFTLLRSEFHTDVED